MAETIRPIFTLKANYYDYKSALSNQDEPYINDTIYFAVFRTPLSKLSSFSILSQNIPTELYFILKELISQQIYPLIEIQLDLIDESKITPTNTIPESAIIHTYYKSKQYILNINTLSNAEPEQNDNFVKTFFVLVNPIFLFLNNNNTFCKTPFFNKSAKEILDSFESHLKDKFGDVFFLHKVVNDTEFENTYKYPQLLPKVKNDLTVPNMLLYKYKAYDAYGFYFFDDFYLDSHSNKPIVLHYINLADHNIIPQINLLEDKYLKTFYGSNIKKQTVVTDPFSTLTNLFKLYGSKDQEVSPENLVVYDNNMNLKHKHDKGDYIPMGSGSSRVVNNRPQINFDMSVTQIDESVAYKEIYAPDTPEHAIVRYELLSKQIETYFQQIVDYRLIEQFPDTINFGYTYNLENEPDYATSNLFTPISIVNYFYRYNGKIPALIHTYETQMLQLFVPL